MIAAGYLANGAKVYISSRKAAVCDATAARLSETYGGECISLPADMSNLAGIEAFTAAFKERENHLDILVNNAGVAWGAPLEEFPEIGWDKVMDTNVKGVFFLTQKLLPLLEKNAPPETPSHVVNIGSVDGIKTPIFDNFSYGPSKAAVHHLTRVLAAHLIKRNIIVNGIAPGPFPTSMLSAGVGGGAAQAMSLLEQVRTFGGLLDLQGKGYSARLKLLLHSGRPVLRHARVERVGGCWIAGGGLIDQAPPAIFLRAVRIACTPSCMPGASHAACALRAAPHTALRTIVGALWPYACPSRRLAAIAPRLCARTWVDRQTGRQAGRTWKRAA